MKPHESPRINKKSIRGNSGDSWPVWNGGITVNLKSCSTIIQDETKDTDSVTIITVYGILVHTRTKQKF